MENKLLPELKNCPFCGSAADKEAKEVNGYFHIYARCQKCRACAMLESWRTRTDSSAALREALEEVIGCFKAAYAEGLHDKLMEIDNPEAGSLTGLITRRLLPALEIAETALEGE